MANHFAQPGIIQRDVYVDLLDKSMDLVWLRKDRHEGNLSQFFSKLRADSMSYKISSVGQSLRLPKENEDTAPMPYATPATGYDKNLTLVPYRLAVRVTDTMRRADRFGKVPGMLGGLPKAAMRKLEYLRASIINNAFTGTAGADGKPLVGDDHPHENNEAGTWDNEGTGALTHGNLQTLRLLADKQDNEHGYPDPVMLRNLLLSPDLRQKAEELVGAKLMPENALNQPNVLIRNLNIVVSPFMSSTTAYFGFGDLDGEEKGIYEVYLMDPEIAKNSPTNAHILFDRVIKFIVKMGFSASKNVYGSVGT